MFLCFFLDKNKFSSLSRLRAANELSDSKYRKRARKKILALHVCGENKRTNSPQRYSCVRIKLVAMVNFTCMYAACYKNIYLFTSKQMIFNTVLKIIFISINELFYTCLKLSSYNNNNFFSKHEIPRLFEMK